MRITRIAGCPGDAMLRDCFCMNVSGIFLRFDSEQTTTSAQFKDTEAIILIFFASGFLYAQREHFVIQLLQA